MARIDKNGVGHIPASEKLIKSEAFYGRTDLKSIVIPDSMVKIGEKTYGNRVGAFENCTSLTSIVFPASVWEIEENAFLHCSSLRRISFLGSVRTIHKSAFKECESLEQICVPANKIEYYKMLLPAKLHKLIEANTL